MTSAQHVVEWRRRVADRRFDPTVDVAGLQGAAVETGDRDLITQTRITLAIIALIRGDSADAESLGLAAERDLEQCSPLAWPKSERLLLPALYNTLGVLADQQFQIADAAEWYRKSFTLAVQADLRSDAMVSWLNLGILEFFDGRLIEATNAHHRMFGLSQPFTIIKTATLLGLARIAITDGNGSRALALASEAFEMQPEMPAWFRHRLHLVLAEAQLSLGHLDDALWALEASSDLDGESDVGLATSLNVRLLASLGRTDEASSLYEASEGVMDDRFSRSGRARWLSAGASVDIACGRPQVARFIDASIEASYDTLRAEDLEEVARDRQRLFGVITTQLNRAVGEAGSAAVAIRQQSLEDADRAGTAARLRQSARDMCTIIEEAGREHG